MNHMKNTKGITLVALVITIIVLLILAGVTITTLIGDNGLITKAKDAKIATEIADIKEELELAILDIKTVKVSQGKDMVRDDLKELEKMGAIVVSTGIPAEVEYKNHLFEVDENYVVAILKKKEPVSIPILKENTNKIIAEGFLDNFVDQWGKSNWYHSFDNNDGTYTASQKTDEASIGSWIGYDFGEKVYINKVTGKIRMQAYKVQYSDDKETWNDAATKELAVLDGGMSFSTTIENNVGSHRYWRLYVNGGQAGHSAWGAMVWTLQFSGIKNSN